MSVDNYYRTKDSNLLLKLIRQYFSLFSSRAKLNDLKDLLHVTQSEYASKHLKNLGFKFTYLGDYLPDIFFENLKTSQIKKDVVLYNPKKGLSYINKLKSISPDIKFKAIENMSQNELKNLLSTSKVYVDFGHHPGKDRIPREALMSGCCVITNTKGSAKNGIDIPILSKYKIHLNDKDYLIKAKALINDCFVNYEKSISEFNNYRNVIINQKSEFIKNVEVFIKSHNL